MSILQVKQRINQSTWQATTAGRERTEVYDVLVSHEGYDPRLVATAPGIPERWDAHPNERDLFAQDPVAVCNPDKPTLWTVTVTYRSLRTGRPETQHPDPLERPTEYEWDDATEYVYPGFDLDGKPILNSAGDKFEPSIGIPVAMPVLRVTRNEKTFSPSVAYQYAWARNSDSFYGVGAGRALMLPWRAQKVYENGGEYWRVVREIKFRLPPLDTWAYLRVLDAGMRERVDGKLRNITDADGNPATVPMLLNGSGGKLTSGAPQWCAFRIYKSAKFGALKL